MKEKYQNWANLLNNSSMLTDNGPDMDGDDVVAIADFLQSLADTPEQEPDDHPEALVNGVEYVTKANRDWWQAECAKLEWRNKNQSDWLIKQDAEIQSLKRELAAAKARIKEFDNGYADMMNGQSDWMKGARKAELDVRDFGAIADQPKRPLLKDQPEVFEALKNYIDKALHVSNMQHRFMDHGHLHRDEAQRRQSELNVAEHEIRKLLVGDA